MVAKYLLLLLYLSIVAIEAKINIEIKAGRINETKITYSGHEIENVNEADMELFKIDRDFLMIATKLYLGRRPSSLFLNGPTPWNDLYETYGWEPVKKVLTIESARVKSITKKPIQVLTHEFSNDFNNTIKVNTGISQSLTNTLTTSWSKTKEIGVTQGIDYAINVIFLKASGNTEFSFTNTWGKSEEVSQSMTVGATTNVETELAPNTKAKAILTASKGTLIVEVVYLAKLRGNVAVNYQRKFKGHHFYGPNIDTLMNKGGVKNSVRVTETITLDYYTDASLTVQN
ncbi:uncharacterized protein LOC125489233 [Plutella xylostella]|uniref:uncharacterized protein LOC125489233 n=1 Tax=Plutella xylostella TaxID=51655 RepID=UPI002032A975|nr:uncharacterized protein LOC125489233 [Plutella xylostella]